MRDDRKRAIEIEDMLKSIFLADVLSDDIDFECFLYTKGFSIYGKKSGDIIFTLFPLNDDFVFNDLTEGGKRDLIRYDELRGYFETFRDRIYSKEIYIEERVD